LSAGHSLQDTDWLEKCRAESWREQERGLKYLAFKLIPASGLEKLRSKSAQGMRAQTRYESEVSLLRTFYLCHLLAVRGKSSFDCSCLQQFLGRLGYLRAFGFPEAQISKTRSCQTMNQKLNIVSRVN
jgi:hypothetical protein